MVAGQLIDRARSRHECLPEKSPAAQIVSGKDARNLEKAMDSNAKKTVSQAEYVRAMKAFRQTATKNSH